jgi:hypothetical protein
MPGNRNAYKQKWESFNKSNGVASNYYMEHHLVIAFWQCAEELIKCTRVPFLRQDKLCKRSFIVVMQFGSKK